MRQSLTPQERERAERTLERFKKSYAVYKRSRRNAKLRLQAAIEAEVAERRREAAKLAVECIEAGVTMRDIGRIGMRTSDYGTIRRLMGEVDLLEIRENAEAVKEEAHPGLSVEHVSGDEYRVTLSGPELEKAQTRAGWDSGSVPEEYRNTVARRVGERIVPQEDAWIAELSEQHPVVAWLALPSNQTKVNEIVEAMK